jgi:endonuclease YncB( thermonuclease family)
MQDAFVFLTLVGVLWLMVGLIRPRVLRVLLRRVPTRKQIGLMLGVAMLVLVGLSGSSSEEYQDTVSGPSVEQEESVELETIQDDSLTQPEVEESGQAEEIIAPEVPVLPIPVLESDRSADNQSQNQSRVLFEVTEIVDGDTIKVSEKGTLRLIGIDTPETRDPRKPVQCFGVEASSKAKELLTGRKVYLEYDLSNQTDRYGRTLAYVYREDGLFYNAEMIKQGFAFSYVRFPHPRLAEFNTYQDEARSNQRGLWAPDTCNGITSSDDDEVSVPLSGVPDASVYIEGSCASLNDMGLGNFRPGDPNYTAGRDGDKDGVACEIR